MNKSHRDEPLITVATFPSSLEASLAKGALEACGISAFIPDEALGSFTRNRGQIPVGTLQVFDSDREQAIAELRRLQIKIVPPPAD